MEIKRYCHLYYGDGKGKTSILNGTVLRALAAGWKIKYYRFMKNWPSGELAIFKKLGVTVCDSYHSGTKFFWEMNEKEREIVKHEVKKGLEKLCYDASYCDYDAIFIDELFSALDDELITEQNIIDLIINKNSKTELLFSAHEVNEKLFKYFDLISLVQKKKHYYDTLKVIARTGIEM